MKSLLSRIPYWKILIVLTSVSWIAFPILRVTLPPAWIELVFKEGGILETIPVLIYLLLAFLFLTGPYHLHKSKWLLSVVCILFASRELDIHERITKGGFLFFPEDFKIRYPEHYMIVEATGLILALALVGYVCYKYWPVMRANLQERDPHQFMMIGGLVMIALSMITDGFRGKVFFLTGLDIGRTAAVAFSGFEEATEALIPIYFLFGLLQYYNTRVSNSSESFQTTKNSEEIYR